MRILVLVFLTLIITGCASGPSHSPVVSAIIDEDYQELVRLIEAGYSPDSLSASGNSALGVAANRADLQSVNKLLEAGADVNYSANNNWWSPLWGAVRYEGDVATIERLIEAGADIETKSNDGWTPILLAARYRNAEITKLILDNDANIEAVNNHNMSALYLAVVQDSKEVADVLLSYGANINKVSSEGSILQRAASAENVTPAFLRENYDIYQTKIKEKQLAEQRLKRMNELSKRKADIESRDKSLPSQLQRDKYLVAFTNSMKAQNYVDATLYAELIEAVGLPIDNSLYYFWGEALLKLDDAEGAMDKLNQYLMLAGSSGQYYAQALNLLLQAES